MTEKEKKAIENIDKRLTIEKYTKNIATPVHLSDLETVLNLIQKQQSELEKKKQLYERALSDLVETDVKVIKQEKIVNEMAKYIASLDTEEDICLKTEKVNCDKMAYGECEECIKQYFEKQVEKRSKCAK